MKKVFFVFVAVSALAGVAFAQDAVPDLTPLLNLLPQPWGSLLIPIIGPLIGNSWQPIVTWVTGGIKKLFKTEGVQTQLVALAISSTISLIASIVLALATGGFSWPVVVTGVTAAVSAWVKALTTYDTAKKAAERALENGLGLTPVASDSLADA